MLTITAQLDDILYMRLQNRAQKRFGDDPDAMSKALREALVQYFSATTDPHGLEDSTHESFPAQEDQ